MKKCRCCGISIGNDEGYWMDGQGILCISCGVAKGLIPKSKEGA